MRECHRAFFGSTEYFENKNSVDWKHDSTDNKHFRTKYIGYYLKSLNLKQSFLCNNLLRDVIMILLNKIVHISS